MSDQITEILQQAALEIQDILLKQGVEPSELSCVVSFNTPDGASHEMDSGDIPE
jgi:metal-dependent HD superfamily phosphatase/phosphodiesterase